MSSEPCRTPTCGSFSNVWKIYVLTLQGRWRISVVPQKTKDFMSPGVWVISRGLRFRCLIQGKPLRHRKCESFSTEAAPSPVSVRPLLAAADSLEIPIDMTEEQKLELADMLQQIQSMQLSHFPQSMCVVSVVHKCHEIRSPNHLYPPHVFRGPAWVRDLTT